LDRQLVDELLTPTALYSTTVQAALAEGSVKAMAHITGGGLPGNLSRVLPDAVTAVLFRDRWSVPPIFGHIQRLGAVDTAEMDRTFNMGIGLVLVVPPASVDGVIAAIQKVGERAMCIGEIQARDQQPQVVLQETP
ncbi:MAG: AIR synthase-related protein, partial [Myxococcota bacterium]